MEFVNREYFLLLLLLTPYTVWYFFYRRESEPTIRMGDTHAYLFTSKSWRMRLVHLPMVLRCLTSILMVCMLAQPQTRGSWDQRSVEGIDIMLITGVSTSMLAEDLRPSRLKAAKNVAAEFISDRPNDNIGLAVFAGESFTQCPMTTDHTSLLNLLRNVRTDIVARGLVSDSAVVGMGLANVVSRLKDSKAKSKVIILITDGSSNMGGISPITSVQTAQSLGIRVYTIGVETNKVVPYPMNVGGTTQYVNIPVEIGSEALSDIAAVTEGDFYRATNNKELKQIYNNIDKLEKTRIEVKKFSKRYEAFQPFVLAAIINLLLGLLLRNTVLRRIP